MVSFQQSSLVLGRELKGVTCCLVTFSHTCTRNLWLQVWALDRKQDLKNWFDYAGKWINDNCKSQSYAVKTHTHFYKDTITILSSVIFKHVLSQRVPLISEASNKHGVFVIAWGRCKGNRQLNLSKRNNVDLLIKRSS